MLISISEIIKRSYNLYKDNFTIIFKYLLLALIPGMLTMLIMTGGILFFKNAGEFALSPIMFVLLPLAAVAMIIIIVLGIWFNFALMKVIDLLNKKTAVPGVKEMLNQAKTVVWRGLGAIILVGIYTAWPIFVGFSGFAVFTFIMGSSQVLNIIFGLLVLYGIFHLIYFSVRFVFSVYAAVIDGKKTKESMNASVEIVNGRWWKIWWRLFVPALAVYVIVMVINAILTSVGGLIGGAGNSIAGLIISLVNFLVTPYVLAIVIILFDETKKTPTATVQAT